MRILYVEDNPANVFLVKRVAKIGQHEIVNFIDGREAIRKYDDVNPDLVLMDIQLVGETSGLDVVKELRARGVTTPIIAVTAYAMVGDKERCIEAGCNDYLAKPLPIPRLIEIFQQHDINIRKTTASMLAVTMDKIADHTPAVVPQPESAPQETPIPASEVSTTPAEAVPAAATQAASVPSAPAETPAPVVINAVETPAVPVPVAQPAEMPTIASAAQPAETPAVAAPVIEPAEQPAVATTAPVVTELAKVETVAPSHTTIAPEMEDTLPTKAETKPLVEAPKTEASTTEANG
jgi:CheY-like chemotaxis protein